METRKNKLQENDLASISKRIEELHEEIMNLEHARLDLHRKEVLEKNTAIEHEVIELSKKIESLCAPLREEFPPSDEYMCAIRTIKDVVSNDLQWVDSGCANWNSSDCSYG